MGKDAPPSLGGLSLFMVDKIPNRKTYEKLELDVRAIMYLTQIRLFGSILVLRGYHETDRRDAPIQDRR